MSIKVLILLVTIEIILLHAAPSDIIQDTDNEVIHEENINTPQLNEKKLLVPNKIESRAGQTEAPASGIADSFRNFTSQIGNGISGAANGVQQLFQNATGGLIPTNAPSPEQAKLIFDGSSKLIIPLGNAADGAKRFFDFMNSLPIGKK